MYCILLDQSDQFCYYHVKVLLQVTIGVSVAGQFNYRNAADHYWAAES